MAGGTERKLEIRCEFRHEARSPEPERGQGSTLHIDTPA